jgi:hypothetical protein
MRRRSKPMGLLRFAPDDKFVAREANGLTNRPATTKARGTGKEVRGRLSGHGFSTEGREERRRMRSEFPRWGNERADEPYTTRLNGVKNLSGNAGISKLFP